MNLTSDFHIHTAHSCDSACLPMADLPAAASASGITTYGVSDHLHTPYNLPDVVASRRSFEALAREGFHFGIEISCVSTWELEELATGNYENPVYGLRSGGPAGADPAIGLTEQDITDLGIEYVIGGTHWPLYVELEPEIVTRDYHRQNMFLATHPLVDIVAHPWWWMGKWKQDDGTYPTDPWFDDFTRVPLSMHDEFAAAAVQHGTAVEINLSATLLNPGYPERFHYQYADYLAYLQGRGVQLSVGSDCHSATYAPPFARAAEMLAQAGVNTDNLWLPGQRTN
ncbi:MAG: hypothetical protein ABFD96_08665 [Armatimonadia bacterium]